MNRVKENIKLFLPALIEIVGDSDFDWNYIDNLFSKKLNERTLKAGGGTLLIEATIYDIIIQVKKGNQEAIRLLSFFQKLLEELSTNLIEEEQKLVKKNVRNLLISFDSKYLNFVGEIAVLNNLLKSKMYRLEDVETKLSSKKSIDFTVKKIDNRKLFLVEIVNIHLDSNKIENDETKIKKFFADRLVNKIKSKKSSEDFFLVPVLWGGWKDVKIYSDYFKKNRMDIKNVLEPVSYVTFSDPHNANHYFHRFGNVSNLFDSINLLPEKE